MILKLIAVIIFIIVIIFTKIIAILKLGFGDYSSKKEFWEDFFLIYTACKNYKNLDDI